MIYKTETYIDDEQRNVITKTPLNSSETPNDKDVQYWASAYLDVGDGVERLIHFQMEGITNIFVAFDKFDEIVQDHLKKSFESFEKSQDKDN